MLFMIRKNFRRTRQKSFVRSILFGNYRKKLVALFVIGFVYLSLPSALHRIPAVLYHTLPQLSLPEDALDVFAPFPFPEALKPQVNFWKQIFINNSLW